MQPQPEAPYPWQQRQWQQLLLGQQTGRLAHALLLVGPVGVGKSRFASLLAAALLCQAPSASGIACGSCKSCQLLAAGSHPDLQEIQPAEEGKAILVDQIRELERFQGLKALYRNKVVVIAPAEAMNINAANALLKTLEEPTAETTLLLVSPRPQSLLPTLRSRCQRITFPPTAEAEAVNWLVAQGVAEPVRMLAIAGGAPLAALALANGDSMAQRQQAFREWVAITLGREDPVEVAGRWANEGAGLRLAWLYHWIGDLVRSKSQLSLRDPTLADGLHDMLERVDFSEIFSRLDGVQRGLREVSAPFNTQLLLEEILLPWAPTRRSSSTRIDS